MEGQSPQGPTFYFREEDRVRLFNLMSDAQEASRKMAEAAIDAAGIDLHLELFGGGGHGTVSYVYSDVPGVVAAVIDCPTNPPTQAYVYYIDGEAVDVAYPASGAVFPH